ncbi:hypothetical protein FH972_025132 [Carpinus fangiana]|uniref:Uncharacterized protein n=1 Tax=Carpinus fangiana TaxID=176857 RepID=A0A5N6L2P1_9ROSI|nr:hypothetical protein FH972_025132 [Carpinus fangiana]
MYVWGPGWEWEVKYAPTPSPAPERVRLDTCQRGETSSLKSKGKRAMNMHDDEGDMRTSSKKTKSTLDKSMPDVIQPDAYGKEENRKEKDLKMCMDRLNELHVEYKFDEETYMNAIRVFQDSPIDRQSFLLTLEEFHVRWIKDLLKEH